MSEGGQHHEIDVAAKKLCLATAKATTSSASSTMMDTATSMMQTACILAAKKNDSKKRKEVSATNAAQASNSNENNDNNARADSNKNNTIRKCGPPPPPPPPPSDKRATIIASEHQRSIQLHLTLVQHVVTCHSIQCQSAQQQAMAMAAVWDTVPISIEIISNLDQESLMNLSLVSKQLHDIITNEPGNENKIIPVFEVSGSSALKFYQNLQHQCLNKETKNKLQHCQIMRFKDISKFKGDQQSDSKLRRMVRNIHWGKKPTCVSGRLLEIAEDIQMDGITSSYLSSSIFKNKNQNSLLYTLPNILPKLLKVDFSNAAFGQSILEEFSFKCPLLERVTSNNKWNDYSGSGFDFRASKNLKEININNACFSVYGREITDLNNHHEIFMFHRCCKALERVSIRNMKFEDRFSYNNDDDDDGDEVEDEDLTQNLLIKFVRNAPPTLQWFRSDLTPDNMTMLRMERPGIELLN